MGLEISKPRCIVAHGDWCGEAATWSAGEGAVYWVDINRFMIHCFVLQGERCRTWFFDEPVVALSLTTDPARMLVALASRLILWRPEDDSRTDQGMRLDDFPKARLNDGRSDPHGTFWVGSMGNNITAQGEAQEVAQGLGKLFSVKADGKSHLWREDIDIANTMCWSPDGRTLYTGDTIANVIRAYDVDPDTGDISGERPFFEGFDRGLPDGSSVDAHGFLWNCRYGGGCIVRVGPDGTIDRVIDMPSENITTCTFAGPDLSTLLVTTASMGRPPGDRLAGNLFAIDTNVRGLEENRFQLA